jgi:beta-glucosidase/6-phospho-beta-glucosidase/beta-galactosidase
VKGYYSWSFLDIFEWDRGYLIRNSLTFVDYNDNLKRHSQRLLLLVQEVPHKISCKMMFRALNNK